MARPFELPSRLPAGPTVVGSVILALTAPAVLSCLQIALHPSSSLAATTMRPVLALGLSGLGVSLLCHAHAGRWRTPFGNIVALLAAALGLATLAEGMFIHAESSYAWLDPQSHAPGLVALGLVAVGTSLGIDPRSRASIRAGVVGLAAGWLIVLGSAYERNQIYTAFGPDASAPVIITLLAALGALLRHEELGVVAALRAPDEAGTALRRSLLVAVVVPSVFGQLALVGSRAGLYGDATGAALLAAVSMTALVVIAFVTNRVAQRAQSARFLADAALAASEVRHRRIFDRASVGIAEISSLGRWLKVNERLCEMLGYSATELQSKTYPEVSHPDDFSRDGQEWELLRRGDIEEYAIERRFIRKQGDIVHTDVRLVRVNDTESGGMRFVAVVQDITARITSESNLRLYQRAVGATQNGVLITDARKPKHPIISVNAAFERITGYRAAEVLGRNCRFLNEGARGQAGLDELRRAIQAGESCSVLLRNFRANGVGFWNSLSIAPVHDAEGCLTHFVGAMRDATEEVQLIAEREALLKIADERRREAEVANASKDRFLSVVSHELRSPMNAIISWASLLRDEQDPAKQARGFDAIEASIRAQTRLLDDLLDTSRIRSGELGIELARIDLAMAVQAAFDRHLQDAGQKQIALRLELPKCPAPCHADSQRVDQILDNLIGNALKFTPAGGTVHVELRDDVANWEIVVRDTGKGLPESALPLVFEEFWQVEPRGGRGLGLGLAIVKYLVERQGGSVSVDSAGPGLGANFRVALPKLQASDQAIPASRPVSAPKPAIDTLAGSLVVVVDDDRSTAEAFASAFEYVGVVVRIATSVADALTFISESPVAVISDIRMPERDGFDLIRSVRGSTGASRGLLAIAVTTLSDREDRRRIQRAGFDAYLAKPVKAQQVVERVAELRARLEREKPPMRRLLVLSDERIRAVGTLDALRGDGHEVIEVADATALQAAMQRRADVILVVEPVCEPAVSRFVERMTAFRDRPVFVGLIELGVEPARSVSDFLVPIQDLGALRRLLRLLEETLP